MGIIIVVIYFKKMAAKSVTNQDFKETWYKLKSK
jgi:hypothetical protein